MLLIGEKVKLRPYRREDVAAIRAWTNDYEVTRYLSFWVKPASLSDTERFVETCMTESVRDGVELAICLKDDPEETYIGGSSLRLDLLHRFATLGIVIGRKDLQGQGLGRDAITTLLEFGFGHLGLNKVNLSYWEFNERGRRCYEACGFRPEGRIRQRWFREGRFWDEVEMGITAEEFRARRAAR